MWDKIETLAGKRKLPVEGSGSLWLIKLTTDNTHWLVGQYGHLDKFAKKLRNREDLRNLLSDVDHKVRLGLRDNDAPPKTPYVKGGYGPTVIGKNPDRDYNDEREEPSATPAKPSLFIPENRKTDREQNVADFWAKMRPQSHHIVEYNNLVKMNCSKPGKAGDGEMDYKQLPAVLLAAEFHQRYISSILSSLHGIDSKEAMEKAIAGVYHRLYAENSALFSPLWEVSKIILDKARLSVD